MKVAVSEPLLSSKAVFSPTIILGLVGLADAVAILGSGLLIYLLYVTPSSDNLLMYVSVVTAGTGILIVLFSHYGLYTVDALTNPVRSFRRIVMLGAIVFLSLLALAFAFKISSTFSRVWAFSWFCLSSLLVCAARTTLSGVLKRMVAKGWLACNVVIVGTGAQAQKLVAFLQSGAESPWIRIVGIFDDRVGRRPARVGATAVLGGVPELVDFSRRNRVDEIVIALPWSADARILEIISTLRVLPAHIRLGADTIGLRFPNQRLEHVGNVPCLNIAPKPISGWSLLTKALEDYLFASLVTVLALPVFAAVALAIRFDSEGPVIFRQKRYGFNNQVIEVMKFRSMYQAQDLDPAVVQAARDDPRVTRVGRFLRRSSLDELPQLFNVLKGEMSLVGPRPHAIPHNEKYASLIDQYLTRHRVKPGITGLAQINGFRGETDTVAKMQDRVTYDLMYIENWSFAMDLRILFQTVWIVWRGENAY